MQFFKVILTGPLLAMIVFDYYTSYTGARAFFPHSETIPAWFDIGLPIAMSATVLGVNFFTTDLLSPGAAPGFLVLFWLLCIFFDAYTTFLGVGSLRLGGGLSVGSLDIGAISGRLGLEDTIIVAAFSSVLVGSPMFSLWVSKR